MRPEEKAIINGDKVFFVNRIIYIFPNKTSRVAENWGVLEYLKGQFYDLKEINEIIASLIKSQPYINGSMQLEVDVSWKVKNLGGTHHHLTIKNYFYEQEEVDEELNIQMRREGTVTVIDDINELRSLGKLPKKFVHNGHQYEAGSSSANGMTSVMIENSDAYIIYTCFDKEIPYQNKYIIVAFKTVGTSLVIDVIKFGDRL